MNSNSNMYRQSKKIVVIAFIWLVIASIPVQAQLLKPEQYKEGQCELIAKDFQKEFGGSLVLLVPTQNGNPITGDTIGHFVNKLYIKGNKKYFYFDWASQSIFRSRYDVERWYYNMTDVGTGVTSYDLSYEYPPGGISWRY